MSELIYEALVDELGDPFLDPIPLPVRPRNTVAIFPLGRPITDC